MPPEPAASPLVDVLLPVYNGAETIEESIQSLLDQTERNLRILVIDDGSSDATPDILARLAESDPRVVPVTIPNGGIVNALNLGLSKATARYVARQDADDLSFPDRIAKQVAELERDPETVAISGACVHIDQAGKPTGHTYLPPDPDLADYSAYPSTEPYLLHPFLMVRRSAFVAAGGYRYVIHSEDTDLYWRLREQGRLKNLPEPAGKMRIHQGSISNASIINGRTMAVTSQLAAVSARRRAEGREDIEFPKDARSAYTEARSLESMIALASEGLDEAEKIYLRHAACVGLLDMSLSRDYELEREDCRYIRESYRTFPEQRIAGRNTLSWAYRSAVVRMLRKGWFGDLLALMDVPVFCKTAIAPLMTAKTRASKPPKTPAIEPESIRAQG